MYGSVCVCVGMCTPNCILVFTTSNGCVWRNMIFQLWCVCVLWVGCVCVLEGGKERLDNDETK